MAFLYVSDAVVILSTLVMTVHSVLLITGVLHVNGVQIVFMVHVTYRQVHVTKKTASPVHNYRFFN